MGRRRNTRMRNRRRKRNRTRTMKRIKDGKGGRD
jgi:hypothetical protein